jgi:hypothetical protein
MILKIKNKLKRDGIFRLTAAVVKYPFTLRRRLKYKKMLTLASPKDRFSEIYKNNLWLSPESSSGEGSEVAYTEPLRGWLINNINSLGIEKIVDAPCGDFNWMKLVLQNVNVEYIGLDIVDDVIYKNNSMYGSDKIFFNISDICREKIPDCDLIIVRDFLFHLSYEDSNRFLDNLSRVDYKFLLTSTHTKNESFHNCDIKTGDFRLIDLYDDPFLFETDKVISRVTDCPKEYRLKREMILLEKKFVPTTLKGI